MFGDNECCSLTYTSTINCVHAVACAGSVVLTQTHPAAPYVCRTGNTTLRCQYDGVENVLAVLCSIGTETTASPSTIPGHTALPCTTTYLQEVVVDSYTNFRERYQCSPRQINSAAQLNSNFCTNTFYSTELSLYVRVCFETFTHHNTDDAPTVSVCTLLHCYLHMYVCSYIIIYYHHQLLPSANVLCLLANQFLSDQCSSQLLK